MQSYLTADEIEAIQTSGLPTNTPYLIQGVSQTVFSIARYFGGGMVQGQPYIYHQPTDELIRADVRSWVETRRYEAQHEADKPAAIKADEAKQGQLFGEAE